MIRIPLHEVQRDSKINVEHLGLEIASTGEKIKELEFKHIDGMYSVCYFGEIPVHLSASTEVYVVD